MANNFKYYSPTEVIFGQDAEQETGKQLKKLGRPMYCWSTANTAPAVSGFWIKSGIL